MWKLVGGLPMLMHAAKPVAASVITLFYVWNLVILLGVVILGGVLAMARMQSHPLHPWTGSPPARKLLIIGLGGLWIVDGLLQAQPLMVTQFIRDLLVPLLSGQPTPVAALMHWGISLWRLHPGLWDLAVTWFQILLGLVILLGRETPWRRVGLWLSIGWGAIVWTAGEGLGSLLSGGSWFVGSPGSVLLYVVAAGILLLPVSWWTRPGFADRGRQLIAGLWGLLAVLQAWPASGWWSANKLPTIIVTQARMAQPAFISAPLYTSAHLISQAPQAWNAAFVVLFALLAVSWGWRRPSRAIWVVTVVSTLAIWWIGQDLGVFGGMGTDPNSGAVVLLGLMVYAGIAFSPARRIPQPPHSSRAQSTLTS